MTLPTFQANMERIYPFAKRTGAKKGIIQNINFQYTVRGENRLEMMDDDFLSSKMFDNAKSGFKHQIPLSTSFKIAKHFNFSIGGNYEDTWVFETIKKNDYDTALEAVAEQVADPEHVAAEHLEGHDEHRDHETDDAKATSDGSKDPNQRTARRGKHADARTGSARGEVVHRSGCCGAAGHRPVRCSE